MTRPDSSLYIGVAVAIALFGALGLTFARRPFAFFDALGTKISGGGIRLAIVFTRSGYSRWLGIVAVLGAIAAVALRENLALIALLIALQLLSQLSANGVKRLVARMRPEVWHFREELGFAYPSGHAVTGIVFYIGWATVICTWHISPATGPAVFVAAVLWAFGIGWSRIALGAHRVTDVLGGYLLGVAWLCAFLALIAMLNHTAARLGTNVFRGTMSSASCELSIPVCPNSLRTGVASRVRLTRQAASIRPSFR